MVPIRTCIGCRSQTERNSAVRFVLEGDQLVLDPGRRMPGRGAWVHLSSECLETALKRRAFNRAFRRTVSTDGISASDLNRLRPQWPESGTNTVESGLERDEHPMSTDG